MLYGVHSQLQQIPILVGQLRNFHEGTLANKEPKSNMGGSWRLSLVYRLEARPELAERDLRGSSNRYLAERPPQFGAVSSGPATNSNSRRTLNRGLHND